MPVQNLLALELHDVDVEPLELATDFDGLTLETISGAQAVAELATSCLYACSCCAVCCCCCGWPG